MPRLTGQFLSFQNLYRVPVLRVTFYGSVVLYLLGYCSAYRGIYHCHFVSFVSLSSVRFVGLCSLFRVPTCDKSVLRYFRRGEFVRYTARFGGVVFEHFIVQTFV